MGDTEKSQVSEMRYEDIWVAMLERARKLFPLVIYSLLFLLTKDMLLLKEGNTMLRLKVGEDNVDSCHVLQPNPIILVPL